MKAKRATCHGSPRPGTLVYILSSNGKEEDESSPVPATYNLSAQEGDAQWRRGLVSTCFGDFQPPQLRTWECDFSVAYGEEIAEYDQVCAYPLVTAPVSNMAEDSYTEGSSQDLDFIPHFQNQTEDYAATCSSSSSNSGERTAQRRYDLVQYASHRKALHRRVDLANQRAEERRLRVRWRHRAAADPGADSDTDASVPARTSSTHSRSSLSRSTSCDSLRVHRHRPKGNICKAFIKDLKRKYNTVIETEALETEHKFPDFSLGIIPDSYCLRSKYFEYDLLNQFGEVPGYPEGRGILESRSSKIRRGVNVDSYSRKRRHDEDYENELSILYYTKENRTAQQNFNTMHSFTCEDKSKERSDSLEFHHARKVTVGVQVNIDCGYECDERRPKRCISTPVTPTLKRSEMLQVSKANQFAHLPPIPMLNKAKNRIQIDNPHHDTQRPIFLPPLVERKHLAQKPNAINSDSRQGMRLTQTHFHLPPIGERGQGDQPCKYVSDLRQCKFPSKYPCLPPISKTQGAIAVSRTRVCNHK